MMAPLPPPLLLLLLLLLLPALVLLCHHLGRLRMFVRLEEVAHRAYLAYHWTLVYPQFHLLDPAPQFQPVYPQFHALAPHSASRPQTA